MATRKDIAREAGVSEGTVSNVLNGRTNVSSEKIRLVEAAAKKMGYVMNEQARVLRKGNSNTFAIILPNIHSQKYTELFNSFRTYAEEHNYQTRLYLTNDNPNKEKLLLKQLHSDRIDGIATVSSLENASAHYMNIGFSIEQLLFIERFPSRSVQCIGFDYAKAGQYFGNQAALSKHKKIALITGSISHFNESTFYQTFVDELRADQREDLCVIHLKYPQHQPQILQLLNSSIPEIIYASDDTFAEAFRKIFCNFFSEPCPPIHTISSLFSMPEENFDKYELNYSLLGQKAAKQLIKSVSKNICSPTPIILKNDGQRNWIVPASQSSSKADSLNLLLLDSPETLSLQSMAKMYTKQTGIPVFCHLRTYEEIQNMLNVPEELRKYDIVRLDITFLSWFAEKLLIPFDKLDPTIEKTMHQYIPGIAQNYSCFNNHIYTLPFSPSVQILYYRKDLFENTMLRRMYLEKAKTHLKPPATFDEFHQIAEFFTKACNPASPVTYGTCLTLGTKGVAASEFMARYRALSSESVIHDEKIRINSEIGSKALEQLLALKPYAQQPTNVFWSDTATDFAAGNSAMAIIYSNYGRNLLKSTSKIVGKIGAAMIPGHNPLFGGGALGIPIGSAYPHEALRFIRWLCSDPISSATTLLNGISICQSAYDNVEIQSTYPWLNIVHNSFSKATPFHPISKQAKTFNERLFLNIIGEVIMEAYTGNLTPQEAMDKIQSEIIRKMY